MKTEISEYEKQAIEFLQSANTEFISVFKEFGSMNWDKSGEKRNIFNITLKNERHAYTFQFGSSLKDSCKESSKMDSSNEEIDLSFGFVQGEDRQISFTLQINTTYGILKDVYASKKWLSLINNDKFANAWLDYQYDVDKWNAAEKRRKGRSFHILKSQNDVKEWLTSRIIQRLVEISKETTLGITQADGIKHPSAYDVLACLQKYDTGTFENFCSDFGYDTDSRTAVRTFKAVRKEWQNVSKLFTETELQQLQDIN